MTWEPISAAELRQLLSVQVPALSPDEAERWARYRTEPEHVPCVRQKTDGTPGEPEPMFVVARDGAEVLVYDDVEDEFGTGTLDPDGVLRQWGTYGEQIEWSLRHFPSPFASCDGPGDAGHQHG